MIFESTHPLVKHKLTLLRNANTTPKKFRELVRELAMLLCYEATFDLGLKAITVETPMGETTGSELVDKIGLIPILRAGLGMTTNCPPVLLSKYAWCLIQCWQPAVRPWLR
jgi:uracil phosphoribosyltransferase